jgi:hypothetical protein
MHIAVFPETGYDGELKAFFHQEAMKWLIFIWRADGLDFAHCTAL